MKSLGSGQPWDRISYYGGRLPDFIAWAKSTGEGTPVYQAILREMRELLPDLNEIIVTRVGTDRQGLAMSFREQRGYISAPDLSDGTMLTLGLICLLHGPMKPELLCLEEPEDGLHPRRLRWICDRLLGLAYPPLGVRPVQVFLTTHSPSLVDLFYELPRSLLVVEQRQGRTKVTSMSRDSGTTANHRSQRHHRPRVGNRFVRGAVRYGDLGGVPCRGLRLPHLPRSSREAAGLTGPDAAGNSFSMRFPRRSKRFYNQCAQLAVIGVDNDGNEDLNLTGRSEDAKHPRHWNHSPETSHLCRWCMLNDLITRTRDELDWLPRKPGGQWPIILAVPVEMIESWLLIAQAIVSPGKGDLSAESTAREAQKKKLYSQPVAARENVERVAMPLIRTMTSQQIGRLASHSRSFANFVDQITLQRAKILGSRDCWSEGDRGAER